MSHAAMGPVQAAVYGYLSADTALKALVTVYDEVPEDTAYPYLEFGELVEDLDDTLGSSGRVVTISLYGWSEAAGFAELQAIEEELFRLLQDGKVPNPTGWTTWSNECQQGAVSKAPDGITRMLLLRFVVRVQA